MGKITGFIRFSEKKASRRRPGGRMTLSSWTARQSVHTGNLTARTIVHHEVAIWDLPTYGSSLNPIQEYGAKSKRAAPKHYTQRSARRRGETPNRKFGITLLSATKVRFRTHQTSIPFSHNVVCSYCACLIPATVKPDDLQSDTSGRAGNSFDS